MTEAHLRYSRDEYIEAPTGFCPGCGVALALRYFLKVLGGNVLFVMPPGCAAPSVVFPHPSLVDKGRLIEVIHCPFGSTATFAAGIQSSFEARGDDTQVIAWAGDGATFDIGMAGVSACAERNENIIYVCYDNEAYMNTGNQRSGATPRGARTTTSPAVKHENKKDIMWIMMGHGVPYAATATIGYADDLMAKVKKARNMKGFRFFHVLTPCVPGWGFKPEMTLELSRLAVQTRVFPLFEAENGKVTITKNPKARQLAEYLKPQGRFKQASPADVEQLERYAEQRWARLNWMAGFDGTGVHA
jgi:pyruvate/2-oxoacid:ferredoxin oxidoreductase beta subunit